MSDKKSKFGFWKWWLVLLLAVVGVIIAYTFYQERRLEELKKSDIEAYFVELKVWNNDRYWEELKEYDPDRHDIEWTAELKRREQVAKQQAEENLQNAKGSTKYWILLQDISAEQYEADVMKRYQEVLSEARAEADYQMQLFLVNTYNKIVRNMQSGRVRPADVPEAYKIVADLDRSERYYKVAIPRGDFDDYISALVTIHTIMRCKNEQYFPRVDPEKIAATYTKYEKQAQSLANRNRVAYLYQFPLAVGGPGLGNQWNIEGNERERCGYMYPFVITSVAWEELTESTGQ